MIKVSVIVPIYNGEACLRECLDSIANQSLKEIEIICVDDGSTDGSLEILKGYKDKDDRFHIFKQEHQYAGSARNLGMSHAEGEYLAFWDSDDFFDLSALEKLYEKAKRTDADVVVCGADQYFDNKHQIYPSSSYLNMKLCPDAETFNRYSNPRYYLNFTTATAWNKLFKRSYIEKIGLSFQNIRNGNDVYFTVNAIGLANKIAVVNENLATYRRNKSTGLVSSLSRSPLSPIQAWIDTAENLEKYDGFGEQSFANKALDSILYALYNIQEWDSFYQAVEALHSYGLNKMHIFVKQDYYYNSWREECATRLHEDTAEQIAVFLMHHFYMQRDEFSAELRLLNVKKRELKEENRNLKVDNKKLKKENENIYNSTTFHVGQVVTYLPRKIKSLCKK